MRGRIAALLAVLGTGTSLPAAAVTIHTTEITHDGGRYTVAFDVLIRADSDKVRTLMTDYEKLDRLSNLVTESRILETLENGAQRVKLTMHGCVLIFCRTLSRVEDVVTEPNGDIVTRVLPELSDFAVASERWRILPVREATRVRYEAELVPSFFVPPLIGPLIMKSRLRTELETIAARIEALAHGE